MKKVLLLALGIVFSASLAFGQAGYIGLFSDALHTSCNMTITDLGGTKRIYVFHMMAAGTTACMFGIQSTGFTGDPDTECEMVGITNYFTLVIGDPFFEAPYDTDNAGVAFSYGSCVTTGAIQLSRITFSCIGEVVPPPCSKFEAVAAPDAPSGTIEVVDCADGKLVGNGSLMYVNPDGTCICGEVVPVQDSSWGKIKSLYNL
jgi:hypothetical protein